MAVVTLLDAVTTWARERGVGYARRWVRRDNTHLFVLRLGSVGTVEVRVDGPGKHATVLRENTEKPQKAQSWHGLQKILSRILYEGGRVCSSPRHTAKACAACCMTRRSAGRTKPVTKKTWPAMPDVAQPVPRPRQVLPPDDVPDERLKTLRPQPKTVEEAEAELERLMRQDAPPEALRAAGARLDKLLEKRPLN